MIGFRLFRSQMPSLLLYALFPRVKQKELTSFTILCLGTAPYSLDKLPMEYPISRETIALLVLSFLVYLPILLFYNS